MNMKKSRFAIMSLMTVSIIGAGTFEAHAQYYELANQIPNLITPALSGSMRYKGFIEAEYLHGLGDYSSDFVELSTVQGFSYSSWFFMGAGLGLQYVHTNPKDGFYAPRPEQPGYGSNNFTRNGLMIPIFTDFRFNIGSNPQAISFYADIRLGASFLATDGNLAVGDGYITNNEYFYLRPALGFRIPTNKENPKQAFDIGISYQLLTCNFWNTWQRNTTVNALGVNISYEW